MASGREAGTGGARAPVTPGVVGTILALVAAAAGAAVGHGAGRALTEGFRFDWYVHPGAGAVDAATAAAWAARVAGLVALAAAPAAVALACRRFDRAAVPVPRARRTRPRDVHALLVTLAAPLALAAAAAGAVLAAGDGAAPLPVVLAASGGGAGLVAALGAGWATARGLARGRIVRGAADTNLIARVMLLSSRHAWKTLAAVMLVTLVAVNGLTLVTTEVDVAEVLPRGDPNTAAAHNLTADFKSTFTQQVTFQMRADSPLYEEEVARKLPYRATDPRPGNITDEVYVRALDEMLDFIKSYVPPGHDRPPFESSVALPDFYRLINWTAEGGINAPNATYALPEASTPAGAMRYRFVDEGVWRLIPDAAEAVISPDYAQTAVLVSVDPHSPLSSREIGEAALAARDAYVAWAESDPDAFKVFTGENAPMFTVDLPLANAHQSRLAKEDFSLLLPVIAAYIAACLWFAFRNLKHILVAFTALGVSMVWTFGAMGYMGIPMNTLNLAVVPLIMGVGIDYGIHVMNEFQHGRAMGLTNADAFRRAGGRTGLALFIATTTSIAGLAVMVVSPSLMIAQLGFLSALALAAMYLLMVTYVPALTSLLHPRVRRHTYRPSYLMASAARGVAHRRPFVAVALVLLAGAAVVSAMNVETEPFGDHPQNWLPDDPMRVEHEHAGRGFYATDTPDVKANVLVFEGDITDPAAHAYMDAIEASLKEQPRVIDDTLRTLPFIVRTYLTVREGVPGAAQYTLLDNLAGEHEAFEDMHPYPETREESEALMHEVRGTPLYEFANLFYNYPSNDMAIMTFSARARTYEDAVDVWDEVWAAVDANEDQRPEDIQVSFVGNTATNYLFVAKQVPWLNHMSLVVSLSVVLLVLAILRDVRMALAVGAHNLLTVAVWMGLLPHLGVGLAITLTLPLVFIFAMGSDYAVHMGLACRKDKDPERAFATTGKAILYSFVTTFGSFLLFTNVSNLAVQRTMAATAAAIVVIFLATVVLLPLFYASRGAGGRRGAREPDVIIRDVPPEATAPVAKGPG